jgi:hypothetical protein
MLIRGVSTLSKAQDAPLMEIKTIQAGVCPLSPRLARQKVVFWLFWAVFWGFDSSSSPTSPFYVLSSSPLLL